MERSNPRARRSIALLLIAISLLLQVHLSCAADIARGDGDRGPRKRLGILTAGLPWTFGPYQSQSYELSLLLSHQHGGHAAHEGYEVYWLTFSHQLENIPQGEYTYEQLRPYTPRVVPPADDFVQDHLTYVGTSDGGGGGADGGGRHHLRASFLNALATRHDLSAMITLMDITRLEPDVPFALPVVGWVPLHSDGVSVPKSTIDYWVLRNYHGLAALAPSSRDALQASVGKYAKLGKGGLDDDNKRRIGLVKQILGKAEVRFVPHIINWRTINDNAERGYELLRQYSLMETDARLWHKPPLRRRGMEELTSLQGSQVPGSANDRNNLFGAHREDAFVVLMQGGNYDKDDRKGWNTSFQAFVRFYNALPNDEARAGVHLLVHSMESYLIEADNNNNEEAPPTVLPEGHLHERLLHQLGLPRSAYTIDMNVHAEEVVAAYKKRASVCLHPSKVEGFGMNVLECQAAGTPVITTNYTAMGDFTNLGISVPVRQSVKFPSNPYWMATPDVPGIADALMAMYDEHMSMVAEKEEIERSADRRATNTRLRSVKDTRKWLDATFSPTPVSESFFELLQAADEEYRRRNMGIRQIISGDQPPGVGAFRVLSGYHVETADWDEPWTLIAPDGMDIVKEQEIHSLCWMILLGQLHDPSKEPTNMIRIAATHEDGRHHMEVSPEEAPILVRTYVLSGLQHQATKRKSLVYMIYGQMRNPQVLGEGSVVVRAQKSMDEQEKIQRPIAEENPRVPPNDNASEKDQVGMYKEMTAGVVNAAKSGGLEMPSLIQAIGNVVTMGLNRPMIEVKMELSHMMDELFFSDDSILKTEDVPSNFAPHYCQLFYKIFIDMKENEINRPAEKALSKAILLVESNELDKEMISQSLSCWKLQHAGIIENYPSTVEEEEAVLAEFERRWKKLKEIDDFDLDPTNQAHSLSFCVFSTFHLSLHYDNQMMERVSLHQQVVSKAYPHIHEPLPPHLMPSTRMPRDNGVIRLGIASGTFHAHAHPVTSDFGGVLDKLPHVVGSNGGAMFEIVYIFFDEKDESAFWLDARGYTAVEGVGASTGGDFASAQNYLHLHRHGTQPEWVRNAQESIASLHLDVLFYLDLTMSPFAHIVAAGTKLAPVQAVSHGHPVTSGLPAKQLDYYVSWAAAELPTAADHYSEELILLPGDQMHQYYVPRVAPDGETSTVDGLRFSHLTRQDFIGDTPPDSHWYLCMQKPHKFSPAFDRLIAGVQAADPKAYLILHDIDEEYNQRQFVKRLERSGVVPERVRFLKVQPHSRLMALYSLSDVVLDSYYAGGCTTTREALEVGALVVTLPAQYLGSRWSLAYYNIMGVTDLIARSEAEYVDIAVRMATDKASASAVREKILSKKHLLFHRQEAVDAWVEVLKTISKKAFSSSNDEL